MKVVILHSTLPAYRKDFFESLNSQLKTRGIDLTVIHGTSFFNKSIKFDENPGYTAIPLKTIEFKFLGFDIVFWRGLLNSIRRIKPEILIIHPGPGNMSIWFVRFFCYLHKVKIGLWGAGYVRPELKGIKRKLRDKVEYLLESRASFILTYGSKCKDDTVKRGIDVSKIFVAQNTLNVEKILSLDVPEKINGQGQNTIFLFVGALIPEKNLHLAIKAIAILVREKFNITFNIIGKGDIIDDLRLLVDKEGMGNNIFILGPKYDSELTSYFFNADIFLLPGTGGLAINEAMAYGLPVISTLGDGTISDLIYEGENGYFLNDHPSVEEIYNVCKKVLALSHIQLAEMGIQSKKIVSEKATLKNMVTSFETAILKELTVSN